MEHKTDDSVKHVPYGLATVKKPTLELRIMNMSNHIIEYSQYITIVTFITINVFIPHVVYENCSKHEKR